MQYSMSGSDPSLQNERGTSSLQAPPLVATPITLQVGERRFVTTSETLTRGSVFFSTMLSGRRGDNMQPDGSYFIDADDQLFEHILRYLRRGVLPIFYDNAKGHDHALYLALLEEAKYFQIPRLEKWLQDKSYVEAVRVMHSWKVEDDVTTFEEKTRTDTELEFHPSWVLKKAYVSDVNIESYVLKTLVVRKRIIIDQVKCIEGG